MVRPRHHDASSFAQEQASVWEQGHFSRSFALLDAGSHEQLGWQIRSECTFGTSEFLEEMRVTLTVTGPVGIVTRDRRHDRNGMVLVASAELN